MITTRQRILIAAGLAVVAGLAVSCSSAPPPQIPVEASETYLDRLAGTWVGSYWSAATGRRGRITFELERSEGIAHGEVIMIPANALHLSPAWEERGPIASPQPLHIEIVRAEDNQVTGTLEPYRDPECECVLSTSFVGELGVNAIEGEFVSHGGPGHRVQTGRWRVERSVEDD